VVKASSSPSSSSREAERRGDPMPTSETIEAERIIDEQLHETHEHNNTVFNPCVAEFIGMMSEVAEMQEVHSHFEQLKRQISRQAYEQALDDGKTVSEAKQIAEEIKQAAEVVADADKKSQVKRTETVQKMRRKVAENPQLQAQTQAMSDEQFAEFVKNYTQTHEDSLAQDLINQCVISAIEEQQIHNEASNHLKSMTFSEKAKLYANYFVEELSTQSSELLTLAIDNPQEFVRLGTNASIDVAATIADFMTPLDASAGVEFARGKISGAEFVQSEVSAFTIGLATKKIAQAKCVAKFATKVCNIAKDGVINNVAKRIAQRRIGNTGKFSELTKNAPKGGFKDGKQAHHMPSQRYLEHYDLDTNEGLAVMMTESQHAKTRTFKGRARNIDLNSSYRLELSRDLKDVKRILKEDGSWTPEVRSSILRGLGNFKEEYPQLFEKVKK